MLKKLLSLTIGATLLISTSVSAGERMAKDEEYKPHTECFMHPVMIGTDKKMNPYTKEEYEIIAYFDAITGWRINTEVETIYMDDDDNRWYFPFDDDKYHKHDGIRMSFEKGYEEE